MKLNIFETVTAIYTSPNVKFVKYMNNNFNSYQIHRILSKYLAYKGKTITLTKLSKIIFYLTTKEYCAYAWSLIQPKLSRTPYIPKEVKNTDETKYDFLLDKIKKRLEIGENDWKYCKSYFIDDVKKNTMDYLIFYGCEKKDWKALGLEFEDSKKVKTTIIKEGLDKWF